MIKNIEQICGVKRKEKLKFWIYFFLFAPFIETYLFFKKPFRKKAMGLVGILIFIVLIIAALFYFAPESAPKVIDSTADGIKSGANSIGNLVVQYAQNTS